MRLMTGQAATGE